MVFSSVRASWGQLTRQWAGTDASRIHQSNGLVARQRKGQEMKSQLILGPLHAILIIALLITPLALIFSHKELLSLTESVMYLEGVGVGGRGNTCGPEHISKSSACSDHSEDEKVEEWPITPRGDSDCTSDTKGPFVYAHSLFPVCPHAIPFPCSSLLSLISLAHTLGLFLDMASIGSLPLSPPNWSGFFSMYPLPYLQFSIHHRVCASLLIGLLTKPYAL